MLHKIYDFFGWESNKSLEQKEKENADFIDKLMKENLEFNKKESEREMAQQNSPPLKVSLRATHKKRSWHWGLLMILMAFIQVIAMGNGQRTARRHLIALLKELEYHYGFRFLVLEEEEKQDERKG